MHVGSASRANVIVARAKIAKAAKIDKNTTNPGRMSPGFNQLLIGRKVKLQSKPRVHPAAFTRKKMRRFLYNERRGRSALLTPGPAETAERLPDRLRRPDRPGRNDEKRQLFALRNSNKTHKQIRTGSCRSGRAYLRFDALVQRLAA